MSVTRLIETLRRGCRTGGCRRRRDRHLSAATAPRVLSSSCAGWPGRGPAISTVAPSVVGRPPSMWVSTSCGRERRRGRAVVAASGSADSGPRRAAGRRPPARPGPGRAGAGPGSSGTGVLAGPDQRADHDRAVADADREVGQPAGPNASAVRSAGAAKPTSTAKVAGAGRAGPGRRRARPGGAPRRRRSRAAGARRRQQAARGGVGQPGHAAAGPGRGGRRRTRPGWPRSARRGGWRR